MANFLKGVCMFSFITGSRAYGKPTEESDFDLAVLVDRDAAILLKGAADNSEVKEYGGGRWGADSATPLHLRFGKLNILCFYHEKEFEAWKEVTEDLKMRKAKGETITREMAIEALDVVVARYREEYYSD